MNAVKISLQLEDKLYHGEFGSVQHVQNGPTKENPLNVWAIDIAFQGAMQGTGGYSLVSPSGQALAKAVIDTFQVSDLSQLVNLNVVALRDTDSNIGQIRGIADAYNLDKFVIF